jgi:transposase
MQTWKEITHYAGLDWAKDKHQVVIVDREGHTVADFCFAHTAEGWAQCRQRFGEFTAVAVAIETSQGAAVEKLVESGGLIHPIPPRRAKSYRERKRPSGDKHNSLDAWSLADALRVDGASWKPLAPEDPLVQQLRLLCRDEVALIAQRTVLVNQLQQALYEYYPTALEAFDDWTQPAAWKFVVIFPTPAALASAGRRQWQNFLQAHRLWRAATATQRLEIFARAEVFRGGAAVSAAKSLLAVTLAKLLHSLQTQLDEYRCRIEELFEQHPDRDLFGSLPGASAKLAPRLLSEIGTDRNRFTDANSLQCLVGTRRIKKLIGVQDGPCWRC